MRRNHALIQSYDEFSSILIARFNRKDVEMYIKELAMIRQHGDVDSYINEFQKVAVMVPDMLEKRVVMLFTEGLHHNLRGLVKAFKPNTLQYVVQMALNLETTHPNQQS